MRSSVAIWRRRHFEAVCLFVVFAGVVAADGVGGNKAV